MSIGRVPFQAAARLLVERYGFAQYPKTIEDWLKPEGAIFGYGQRDGIIIVRLTIYARGLVVETQTSTDDCEKILQDLLDSAPTILGTAIPRSASARRIFYSELGFISEASLNWLHPALEVLANKIGPFVAPFIAAKYETTAVYLNVDETNIKFGAGAFRIERRQGIPFEDNAYFSAAPMPTGEHVKALQEFELALLRGHGTPP